MSANAALRVGTTLTDLGHAQVRPSRLTGAVRATEVKRFILLMRKLGGGVGEVGCQGWELRLGLSQSYTPSVKARTRPRAGDPWMLDNELLTISYSKT